MSNWYLLIYGVAVFMALRMLAAMMTTHKQQYLEELLTVEKARRKAAKKAAELAADAQELASARDEDDADLEARLNEKISA